MGERPELGAVRDQDVAIAALEKLQPRAETEPVSTGLGNLLEKRRAARAAARLDFRVNIASPEELAPPADLLAWARREGARVSAMTDPFDAVEGADCVVTDCWVSMGDEDAGRRHNLLAPYQVNAKLMKAADERAIFMHCLPAHRGEEITAEVIDGPRSAVWQQAINRMHTARGALLWLLDVPSSQEF